MTSRNENYKINRRNVFRDAIRNEYICQKFEIAPMEVKMRDQLRWFGHVQCRPLRTPVRKSNGIVICVARKSRCRIKGI